MKILILLAFLPLCISNQELHENLKLVIFDDQLKKDLIFQVKSELKEEMRGEVKNELKGEVKTELKAELSDTLKEEFSKKIYDSLF